MVQSILSCLNFIDIHSYRYLVPEWCWYWAKGNINVDGYPDCVQIAHNPYKLQAILRISAVFTQDFLKIAFVWNLWSASVKITKNFTQYSRKECDSHAKSAKVDTTHCLAHNDKEPSQGVIFVWFWGQPLFSIFVTSF